MRARKKISQILPYIMVVLILVLAIRYWDFLASQVFLLFRVSRSLILGIIIAYIVNILVNVYENKFLNAISGIQKYKRIISIIFALMTMILIIALILLMIIPQMHYAVITLVDKIPVFYNQFMEWIATYEGTEIYKIMEELLVENSFSVTDTTTMVKEFINWIGRGGASETWGALNSALGTMVDFFMGLIFALYILGGKENIAGQIKLVEKKFLSEELILKIDHILQVIDECFHNFIVGQCVEAVIIGTLCTIGMLIFRFPYALMTGVVVGATAIIPVLGAYIGMGVGFIMIFTESPIKALLFVVYLMILQQLENQFIYPKVVGTSIGLPGIWIFASVVIGSGLFGVTGILVFIPLVAAGYQLLREVVVET